MKIVLLSGGKGKRLWPLSTDNVPKQFVPLFNDASSMLKKTYDSIVENYGVNNIYIATGNGYKDEVLNEIKEFKNFILEPAYIGTFGAILNIAIYLKEIEKVSNDEIISIVPIDHDVDKKFYKILVDAKKTIENEKSDICLIGIKPTFPSTQYGYIINSNNRVLSFKEKPDIELAAKLIVDNALWNSGIVNFRLGKILQIAKQYLNYSSYDDFLNKYTLLPHKSFDTEVLEKESNLLVISCDAHWNDLGTWDRLSSKISTSDDYNTNVINFENKKVVNEGIENAIIVNTHNGIKLMKKNINNNVFRQWGYYEVLNVFDNDPIYIKIKKLTIIDNRNISYQYHNHRSEEWFVLKGIGEVIIDGKCSKIKSGDIIKVNKKVKHSIRALKTLEIVEVQYGDEKIEEEDIVRIEYDWDEIIKEHLIKRSN